MCLVGVHHVGAAMDGYGAAVAELDDSDGQDVWSVTGRGSLTSPCLAMSEMLPGSAVELAPCGAEKSSTCKLHANGQIKLGASNR